MANRRFQPTDRDEAVIAVMKREGRANPYLIRQDTDLDKGDVNTSLVRLTKAGWLEQVTHGLYEFVEDPRESEAGPEAENEVEA